MPRAGLALALTGYFHLFKFRSKQLEAKQTKKT
jgi:hypothetical protein